MNREDFPILQQQIFGRPLVYLDNAATSQKPQALLDAYTYAYSHFNANIHRGVHYLSQLSTANHEDARKTVADFICAAKPEEIVFTKGTTDSLNMLAFSFGETYIGEGDEIVISSFEHHSNIVPWQMLCSRKNAVLKIIPLREDLTLDTEAYKKLLTERTKLVSVTLVSNVLGTVTPIKEIINEAHSRNIPVCVDAAQAIAHMPVDVSALDCDFLAFSAHKVYGPNGLGILYGKERFLKEMTPAQGGGEMIEHVSFEKTTYNVLPYKFEAGTPDYIGSYCFAKTIDYLRSIGMQNIFAHEDALIKFAEEQLHKIAGVHVYASGQEKKGVISFNVISGNRLLQPYDVGMLLDKQGIEVRTGHHCAEPLMGLLGVSGTLRLSVGLYNEESDIERFVEALKRSVLMLE